MVIEDMTALADFLTREVDNTSYREVEAKTKVSRGSLENIIGHNNKQPPKLETLEKIATAYELPLWRVIEMAGISLGLPASPNDLALQLTSLSIRLPEIEPIVTFLLRLHPDDLRGVVAYMEAVDQLRAGDSEKR